MATVSLLLLSEMVGLEWMCQTDCECVCTIVSLLCVQCFRNGSVCGNYMRTLAMTLDKQIPVIFLGVDASHHFVVNEIKCVGLQWLCGPLWCGKVQLLLGLERTFIGWWCFCSRFCAMMVCSVFKQWLKCGTLWVFFCWESV